jgi:hypothetical protein
MKWAEHVACMEEIYADNFCCGKSRDETMWKMGK